MMRFDRFSERAQDAAARAYEVMQRFGHNQVDTEHILLALLEQPGGSVPETLVTLGVNREVVANKVNDLFQKSPVARIYGGGSGQVFITPRVKRVIDRANEEANRLKDNYIATEHIFLAILSERNTNLARILAEANVTKERVSEVVQQRSTETAATQTGDDGKQVRLSLDVSLAAVMDLLDQLSLEDAREVYRHLKERLDK